MPRIYRPNFRLSVIKTELKSTVNCGFSALVKQQDPFYFGGVQFIGWGHHEENRHWNRSDPLAAAVKFRQRSIAIAGSGSPWYFDLLLRMGIT
jgi:hypothetical protein